LRVVCVGGGPAGLFFSALLKRARPEFEVVVIERNQPGDTFGWGVVFSDQTLDRIAAADPRTHAAIESAFVHWDAVEVNIKGRTFRAGGQGFAGIARKRLIEILTAAAVEAGVDVRFGTEVTGPAAFGNADIVVAADGANSTVRRAHGDLFGTTVDTRKCRYIWLGTRRLFEAFTFAFEETEFGWFALHAYRFDARMATAIVECREETWRAAGLESAGIVGSIAFCEQIFARYLEGNALVSNAHHLAQPWSVFNTISNERWSLGNTVLLGDAAHTAHFSIGSGTKLALEDAISLAARIASAGDDIATAFEAYEDERRLEVLRLQNAARNSLEWFENVSRYGTLEPEQFAYSLLTRSQRIGHENLRLRDRSYVDGVETWLAARSSLARAVPPMFTPFRLRGLELRNRVVLSPMAMYSCADGVPDDFYLVHLGARAQGGAGLIFTEMTAVSPEARITPGCAGMYAPGHETAWQRIVAFVHARSDAKFALQLGHSGPKGSTQLGWEAIDEPLETGNWPVLGPSRLPYGPQNQAPVEMTVADMARVREEFVRAAEMGARCGFDLLELHCAHGYLLSSFITPLSNVRTDAYGGSLENRLRFPLEVFAAVRAVWPARKPMSVRISATDWVPGGIAPEDAVEIARAFHAAGADLIDVSSGQTSRAARPVYGRMYQTPFADRIRNELGIATMAVGNIYDPDHVNGIIAAGRADLCAIARAHLADPYWTLHAAAALGYRDVAWPPPYLAGRDQYVRNLERSNATGAP